VTVISPSDLTFVSESSSLTRRFVEVVFDQGAATIGEALVRAREAVVNPSAPIIAMTYQLLGDPMLQIFDGSPVATAVGRTAIASRTPSGDARADLLTAIRPATPAARRDLERPGAGFALAPPVPSPCASEARIECTVPASLAGAAFGVAVVDLAGRAVRRLASGSAAAGRATLVWDLRDDHGVHVAPGIYFVRAGIGGYVETRRLVVTGGDRGR